jgi:membrane associated rhomboid family serine protease
MSWRDRPYSGGDFDSYGRGMGLGALKPTPVVLGLIVVCVVAFVACSPSMRTANLSEFGALMLPPLKPAWQVWRYVTYQYLHGGVWHLLLNMLGLFFFGPPLERLWGGRRFFIFYTMCGVVAGLAFAVMQMVTHMGALIGASGSVMGCLAACAVLFPEMMIILLFFPVPIRAAAVLFAAVYVLTILREGNLADAAHLAGMTTGAVWVYGLRRLPALSFRRSREGSWQRKMRMLQEEEDRVDRILDKIRRRGMQSLSWWEKRFLRKASEHRRQFDAQQSRRP